MTVIPTTSFLRTRWTSASTPLAATSADRFTAAAPAMPQVPQGSEPGPRAKLAAAIARTHPALQPTQIAPMVLAMETVLEDARLNGIQPEERQSALLAMADVLPQLENLGRRFYPFHQPLSPRQAAEFVPVVAHAVYTGPLADSTFEYGHSTIQCGLRRPATVSLADDCRLYVELLTTEYGSEANNYNPVPMDPHKNAADALRILKCHLHGDESQSAAFRELLPTFGDPWSTLGVVRLLFTLPAADRAPAQADFLERLKSGRDGAREWLKKIGQWGKRPPSYSVNGQGYGWTDERVAGRALSNLVLFASLRQPREEYGAYRAETDQIWNDVFQLTAPTSSGSAEAHEDQMRAVIEAIGRGRDSDQSLTTSLQQFRPFAEALQPLPPHGAARVYLLAEDKRPQLERFAGHSLDRAAAAAQLVDLATWATRSLQAPPESLPSAISAALGQDDVRQSMQRFVEIFRLTGDGEALRKLEGDVDRDIAAGLLKPESRADAVEQLEKEMYAQAALGRPREQVAAAAWEAVRRRLESHPSTKPIQRGEDAVIIGGVSIPRRRHQD